MISVVCPHCSVKLKVDETRIPPALRAFKCPKCGGSISVSIVKQATTPDDVGDTVLIPKVGGRTKTVGKLCIKNSNEGEISFPLKEGVNIIGRNSKTSNATIKILTDDRSMSREHARIEVVPDFKGGYRHFLSDFGSKNHTFHNDNQLNKGDSVILQPGDFIVIGKTALFFEESGD